MESNSSSPSRLDPIRRWLRHVDEQISPGESVEFLKLPLYPFLRVEYAETEKLKTPRKIYNFLLEKRFQHDKEKALYWFAHALSLLGGDLRGDYLVGDQCLRDYGISLPAAAPSHQMTPELQFFECITKIARKARGYNLEEGLKDRFSRKRFLNVHPNHLKHLPDLFVRLVQRQIIGLTNTYYLHKALVKLGSRRAMQCLICLNEYHRSVGLDEIREVKGVKKDPLTTAFENSCTASSDIGAAIPPRLQKASKGYSYYRYHRHGITRDVGRPVPGQGDMEESLKTLDLSQVESEATSTTDSEDSSDDDQSDSSPIAKQHRPDHDSSAVHRKRTVLCCCLVWVIAIAVALTPSVGLGSTVWRKGLIDTQKPDDVIVYNNSAVVITELDPYYHRQIKLTPMIGIPLRDSVVGIYRFNSSCDRLPTKSNMIRWHKVNVSGDQNYTHLYLLPPSTLNYTISPVDPDPARVVDTDTRLDGRLEKVKGYIYITRGPESQGFDPAKCRATSDCDIVVNHPFTYYDQHSNSYVVDNQGGGNYYNFHGAYVVSDYRYTLDLIINATTVDLAQGQRVCNISDVNQGEGTKSCIDNRLGFKFQANSPVCLVAHMEYYEGNSYIILNVEVTKQLTGILLTSVLPAAIVVLLTFVCLISCTIIKFCCHCCKRQTLYQSMSQL